MQYAHKKENKHCRTDKTIKCLDISRICTNHKFSYEKYILPKNEYTIYSTKMKNKK